MKAGDKVQLIAAERLYEAELTAPDAQATEVTVLAALPSPECATRVTLVQGLPKADKLEMIVQKATELGVWDILPVSMARCVAKLDAKDGKKYDRWRRIALEAAKQSGRAHVPDILPVCGMPEAAQWLCAQGYDAVLAAWEEEGDLRLSKALHQLLAQTPQPKAVALIIGPEGGITPAEIGLLAGAGARCVTLGKRILRTETAGLCALAVTMSALGEM